MQISLEPHPSLLVRAFVCELPSALGALALPQAAALLSAAGMPGLEAPNTQVKAEIRDVLRARGYKPTGRGKPSSEYLVRASSQAALRSINAVVDACNAISLHSGLPISVVDCERLRLPLQIRCGHADESYVFNAAGQRIELAGLPCLCDAEGPCANAVKDAQRTKTSDATRLTLSVLWCSQALVARCDAAYTAYCRLLVEAGASVERVELIEARHSGEP